MLSPINVTYDESNESYNLWVGIIYYYDAEQDSPHWTEVQPFCFGTLGQAQQNYINEVTEWKQYKPGGPWKAALKLKNSWGYKAHTIELHQMLYLNKS